MANAKPTDSGIRELAEVLKDKDTLEQLAKSAQKAANDSGELKKDSTVASTHEFDPETRSIFAPENLDPVIKTIPPTATPIRSVLPRTSGVGQATSWKQLVSKLDPENTKDMDGAVDESDIFFADADRPGQTKQEYTVKSAPYKLLGRTVSIGLQHAAMSQDYSPAEDEDTRVKTLEVLLGEEWAIIHGNSTSDNLQFDGLSQLVKTNTEDLDGADLTVDKIGDWSQSIFNEGGSPTHLMVNSIQSRNLSDEIKGDGTMQRIVIGDQGNATANLRVSDIVDPISGNVINILVSRYLGDYAFLGAMQSPAGENYIEMEDLIPLVQLDAPTNKFAKEKFIVESSVLKLMAEPYWFKGENVGSTSTS